MKGFRVVLAFLLVASLFLQDGALPKASAADFIPAPATPYATTFVSLCEDTQWFINEVESQLNAEQRSIDNLQSRADLSNIVTLGYTGGATKIPSAIGELTELRHLYFSGNSLSDIPQAVYSLSKLEVIDMSLNKFTGSIPQGINPTNFPNLKVLLLWDNKFSGTIPDVFYDFAYLENLDISSNQLTGTISSDIGDLSNLSLYAASNNLLTGGLPATIGNCANLKSLLLWKNQLSGSIPNVFSSLSDFAVLDLANNTLTGNLPPDLPSSMRKISVQNNQMDGQIPSDYSTLTNLHTLDLCGNSFSGEIPSGFSALTQMIHFDVSSNKLRGVIPDVFGGMTLLETANFRDNLLVCTVPQSLVNSQLSGATVNIAKNYLTGTAAASITNNSDNFIDGASGSQNRMYVTDYIQIEAGIEKNIYNLFTHRSAQRMDLITGKVKLPADGYSLELSMSAQEKVNLLDFYEKIHLDELFTVRSDASGWYIAAHESIKTSNPLVFTLRILHNDGSNYSQSIFRVTSEVPPVSPPLGGGASGGSGGGTYEVTPPIITQYIRLLYGYSDGGVHPDGALTREQAAQLFYRVAGEPEYEEAPRYTDVQHNRWSARAIAWLSSQGIILGYNDGTFKPENNITRAEFTTILRRFLNAPEAENSETGFTDVEGHWAKKHIEAIGSLSLINGLPDGSFQPDRKITRAEAVVVLCRMLGRTPDQAELAMNPYTDLSKTHWAYWYILEASREYSVESNGVESNGNYGEENEDE